LVITPEQTIILKFPFRVKIRVFNVTEGKRIGLEGVVDVVMKGFNAHNYRGSEYWNKSEVAQSESWSCSEVKTGQKL